MYAARERKVRLDGIPAPEIALDTCIHLVAFRDFQTRIQATRKLRIQDAELANNIGINAQRLGEAEILRDERTPLIGSHQFACQRIAQQIGVEEDLLLAQGKVVDSPQQRAIE